jgi:3-dehydroquinate synthase
MADPHLVERHELPIKLQHQHRLIFTRNVFDPANPVLAELLTPREPGDKARAVMFWDGGLDLAFPGIAGRIEAWFKANAARVKLEVPLVALPGGEEVKNDFRHLERAWATINQARLCRHSFVIVLGGGAMLDMIGFAASTAHRGIPLVRLPTTSLSQGDGGIGVKNGVNYFEKKNWLGSFVVPHAVVNDLEFLHGLPPRDRRAGLVEAVKVALIRDAKFFEFIEARVDALAKFEREPYEAVIRESARQHMEHIASGGDPFERGSARPLDFGHWAAHKLEQLSDFKVSHGEAVAVGMAMDVIYAKRTKLLPEPIAERILSILQRLGFELFKPIRLTRGATGPQHMLDGLEEFREHLGGRLTIPMVRAPGEKVDLHEMSGPIVRESLEELAKRFG